MPKPKPTSPKTAQRATPAASVRAFAGQPTSVDEATRSFDVVITTETPVSRWIPDPRVTVPAGEIGPYIEVGEVLLAAGIDLSRAPRMSFVDGHDTTTIDKVLGRIENIRVEGQSVVGRVTLRSSRANLLQDIADGFFGQISAGYFYEDCDTEFVEVDGGMPLLIVKRWTLTETSAVTVAADPNAFIRSHAGSRSARAEDPQKPQENTMTLEELVTAAETAVADADAAVEAAEAAAGQDNPTEELVERIKALRGKRAGEDTTDKTDTAAGDGAAADGADMTDAEKQDVDNVRSIAKSYGLEKLVTDMRALGAKPAAIRSAVSKTIAERGAPVVTDAVTVKKPVRSALESFNPNAVYAARRKSA